MRFRSKIRVQFPKLTEHFVKQTTNHELSLAKEIFQKNLLTNYNKGVVRENNISPVQSVVVSGRGPDRQFDMIPTAVFYKSI